MRMLCRILSSETILNLGYTIRNILVIAYNFVLVVHLSLKFTISHGPLRIVDPLNLCNYSVTLGWLWPFTT